MQQQQQAAGKAAEGPRISISPDVLRALAEAEAARAEKMGSSTSNKELQSRVADSIERIVELVGGGGGWVAVWMARCWAAVGGQLVPLVNGGTCSQQLLLQTPLPRNSRRVAAPPHACVQAKRLSEAEAQNGGGGQAGADPSLGDKAVQQELSNLYSLMAGTARGVNPDDVK